MENIAFPTMVSSVQYRLTDEEVLGLDPRVLDLIAVTHYHYHHIQNLEELGKILETAYSEVYAVITKTTINSHHNYHLMLWPCYRNPDMTIDAILERRARLRGIKTRFIIYYPAKEKSTDQVHPLNEYGTAMLYRLVGGIDAYNLNEVWSLAQNHNNEWAERRVRSASIGDVIYSEDSRKYYKIEARGFKEVPNRFIYNQD
jgi:hypothetical protein